MLCVIWVFFRLPEPKPYVWRIGFLFEQRISARKFRTTPVDIFQGVDVQGVARAAKAVEPKKSDEDSEKV